VSNSESPSGSVGSRIGGWIQSRFEEGWGKFVVGLVVAFLGWLGLTLSGLVPVGITAASEAGVARNLAGNPAFIAGIREKSVVPSLPVGAVLAWPAATKPPDGWHVCDGARLPQVEHESLAQVLGATYARRDANGRLPSPGEVQLPDFQGQFLRGAGQDAAAIGEAQLDSFASHAHNTSIVVPGSNPAETTHPDASKKVSHATETTRKLKDAGNIFLVEPTDSVGESETRPKNYAVQWIIRVN
jgi:microcystin-dependent protein